MSSVHTYVGFAIVALFAVGWIWALGAQLAKRGPGEGFWRWLTVVQVVAVVQAVIGIWLLAIGRVLPQTLHIVYGLGPLVILGIAHALARDRNFERRPWVAFGFAAFICFGLTLRALMTGLGIG
ncbi:MAG: hypothetical protein ACKOKE_04250 [Actinomycetota bacterium]